MGAIKIQDTVADFFESMFDISVFYHQAGIALPDISRLMVRGAISVFMSHLKDNTELDDHAIRECIAILVTSELNAIANEQDEEIPFHEDEWEVEIDE